MIAIISISILVVVAGEVLYVRWLDRQPIIEALQEDGREQV